MKKEKQHITIETTAGTFEITLFPDMAPKACENFLKLAKKNYYDGTIFHRIISDCLVI